MTTTVTNSCNGWVGCPQTCYPGSVSSTTKIPEIIPNANIYNLPSTQTSLTIGDNMSGVAFGVAMLPCQGGTCVGDASEPDDACANTCTGAASTACVACNCKTEVDEQFDVNDAGGLAADYYNVGPASIYEFPATINWYGGSNLDVNEVYTATLIPVEPAASLPSEWASRDVSFYVVNNFMFGIARINLNAWTVDTQGRRLYAGSTDQNVRYGSQVAIICYNSTVGRWMYLALSSVSGYERTATTGADNFVYDNWANAWGVWRTLPATIGSTLADAHAFYGDGVWNLWDPNGSGITNLTFQGGAFYLQNWLLATTDSAAATWAEVYQDIPTNLTDTASRVGYLGRFNTTLAAGGGASFVVYRDSYLLDSTTSCLAVQKIAPGYFGSDGTGGQNVGSNYDYYGVPLLGVVNTLAQLAGNSAGLTDSSTCVVGENNQTPSDDLRPECNCTDTKQFFLWYVVAYQGCLVESETVCDPQSPEPQAVASSVPTWVPWVVAILAAIVLILLGFVIWYAVRYKNMETWEADKATSNLGYTPDVTGMNSAGVSLI